MGGYILLTGCTGLVGRYLLTDLLKKGHRLAVVVRPGRKETVFQRVESILQVSEQENGHLLPRPVCFEGDISKPLLGLDPAAQRWVAENCDRMLHGAAVLTFEGTDPEGEPWKSNVLGTRNVVQLCRELAIDHLHYVSTAYVSGLRQDRVKEDELDVGQQFRNDYERSKFEAETLVRQAHFLKTLTVYRPAVVAGDAETGYTCTYHGLYMYLKLMSILVWNTEPDSDGVRYTPVRLNMTGDEPRNIVPVDWVSAVICHLFSTPEAHGKTFHLAPKNPITPRQIIDAGYKYFNSHGVEFCGHEPKRTDPASKIEGDAYDNMGMYESYEVSDPHFDTTNLQKHASHLPCPIIDEPMLHRFWKYGEEDRWGKRRKVKSQVPFLASSLLQETIAGNALAIQGNVQGNGQGNVQGNGQGNGQGNRCANASGEFGDVIGLDVLGPGGGQWQLTCDDRGIVEIAHGLPASGKNVVRLSASELRKLLEMDSSEPVTFLRQRGGQNGYVNSARHLRLLGQSLKKTTSDNSQGISPTENGQGGSSQQEFSPVATK